MKCSMEGVEKEGLMAKDCCPGDGLGIVALSFSYFKFFINQHKSTMNLDGPTWNFGSA